MSVVCVCVCAHPAKDELTCVDVLELILFHLSPCACLRSSDPFVKVYLLQDGRKISKKKTSTKRDDNNPIFNEAMIFSVPSLVLQVTPPQSLNLGSIGSTML